MPLTGTWEDAIPAVQPEAQARPQLTGTWLDAFPASARPQVEGSLPERRQQAEDAVHAEALQTARQKMAGMEETRRSWLARRSLPGGSALLGHRQAQEYHNANTRLRQGNPLPEDYQTIAGYERVQQADEEAGKTWGGGAADILARAPALIGEAIAGGPLARGAVGGLGLAAREGAKVAIPKLVAAGAARTAVQTVAMPSLYAERWAHDNMEQGRDPLDPRGFPAAFAMGMIQNAILGSAYGQVKNIPWLQGLQRGGTAALTGRALAAGGVGTVEMGGADALGKVLGLQTKWGSLQDFVDGKHGDGMRHAVLNGLSFAIFHGLHEAVGGTPEQLRQARELEAQKGHLPAFGPQPGLEGPEALASPLQAYLNSAHAQGLSLEATRRGLEEVNRRVARLADSRPDYTADDLREVMQDLPEGPLRTYGLALAAKAKGKLRPAAAMQPEPLEPMGRPEPEAEPGPLRPARPGEAEPEVRAPVEPEPEPAGLRPVKPGAPELPALPEKEPPGTGRLGRKPTPPEELGPPPTEAQPGPPPSPGTSPASPPEPAPPPAGPPAAPPEAPAPAPEPPLEQMSYKQLLRKASDLGIKGHGLKQEVLLKAVQAEVKGQERVQKHLAELRRQEGEARARPPQTEEDLTNHLDLFEHLRAAEARAQASPMRLEEIDQQIKRTRYRLEDLAEQKAEAASQAAQERIAGLLPRVRERLASTENPTPEEMGFAVAEAMAKEFALDARQKNILKARLLGETLEAVGKRWGMSKEGARKAEAAILKQLGGEHSLAAARRMLEGMEGAKLAGEEARATAAEALTPGQEEGTGGMQVRRGTKDAEREAIGSAEDRAQEQALRELEANKNAAGPGAEPTGKPGEPLIRANLFRGLLEEEGGAVDIDRLIRVAKRLFGTTRRNPAQQEAVAFKQRMKQVEELRGQGLSYPEIAKRLGISIDRLKQLRQAAVPRPGEQEAAERILELASEGMTHQNIADEVGVSRQLVIRRLKEAGVEGGAPSPRHLKGVSLGEDTPEQRQGLYEAAGLLPHERAVLEKRRAGQTYQSVADQHGLFSPEGAYAVEQKAQAKLDAARKLLEQAQADQARRQRRQNRPEIDEAAVPADRAEAVVHLRKQGLTWPAIGARFGISHARALQIYQEATGTAPARPTASPQVQGLKEKLARGEPVSGEEWADAAGLSEKERHIWREALAGRSMADIAGDEATYRNGQPVTSQAIHNRLQDALAKLGIEGGIDEARGKLKAAETVDRVEAGQDVERPRLPEEEPVVKVQIGERLRLVEQVTRQQRWLADLFIRESERGTLTPEFETRLVEHNTRLDQLLKGGKPPAPQEAAEVPGGTEQRQQSQQPHPLSFPSKKALWDHLRREPAFWSGKPYEGFLGESGGVPVPLDYLAQKGQELWQKATEGVGDFVDRIKAWAQPAARGRDAGLAAGALRQRLAEWAEKRQVAQEALEAGKRHLDTWVVNATDPATGKADPALRQSRFLEITDAIENGHIGSLPPELRQLAQALHDLTQERTQELVQRGILTRYIENYMGHLWENPHQTRQNFWQRRTIPTYREGILGAGLIPRDWNPVELVLRNLDMMDRSVMLHDVVGDLQQQGLYHHIPVDVTPPPGMARVPEKVASAFRPRQQMPTPLPEGHYYAPEPVLKLLENYLSPGIKDTQPYSALRWFGNLQNQFQLGFSAFHLGFEVVDSMVSGMALALQQASRGEVGKAGQALANSLINPVRGYLKGKELYNALQVPGSGSAEVQQMARYFLEAGGRRGQDPFYKNNSVEAFRKALGQVRSGQAGATGSLLWHALPALSELVSAPLMEHYVPRLKMGVWLDMVRSNIDRLQGADLATRREVMGKMWDSVENRLGQLTYDNVFWNRTLKDVLMVGVRSVGWNLGTIRELGGGLADLPASLGQIGKGKEGISPRLAYLVALPMGTALMASLYQYLATGKGPEEAMDLVAPRTGGQRPDGVADRVQLPSYMRDLLHLANRGDEGPGRWASNAFDMAKGKIHPTLATIAEMLENKDFLGKAIVNPSDPFVQRSLDTAKHLGLTFESFSLRGAREAVGEGKGAGAAVQGFFGLTSAPARVAHTAQQQREAEQARRHELSPLEKRHQAELRADRPAPVSDYFARLGALEVRRDQSPERRKGKLFAEEKSYQQLAHYKAAIDTLDHLARGDRKLGERWIEGPRPPAERQAQLRQRQAQLAQQALKMAASR